MLYGINKHLIKKLQNVQNAAARVLSKTRKYDHITPVLKQLHWLPVCQRIKFKIILLAWKALNDRAPHYLKEILSPYTPTRNLHSTNQLLLTVPKTTTSNGVHAFSVSAPTLWNSLPLHIRATKSLDIFKTLLKTHLFNISYD